MFAGANSPHFFSWTHVEATEFQLFFVWGSRGDGEGRGGDEISTHVASTSKYICSVIESCKLIYTNSSWKSNKK